MYELWVTGDHGEWEFAFLLVLLADEVQQASGDSDALVVWDGDDSADSEVPCLADSVGDGYEADGGTLVDRCVAVDGPRDLVAQIVMLLKVTPETRAAAPDLNGDGGVLPFFLLKVMSSVQRTQSGSR